jgi:hypothetical protein
LIATALFAIARLATSYCVLIIDYQVRRFADRYYVINRCGWLLAIEARPLITSQYLKPKLLVVSA